MNSLPPNGENRRALYETIHLKDFAVSWAGAHPLQPGFGFGSEDGRLLITDENGVQLGDIGMRSYSHEAINGVALSGTSIAVSTRQEVTMATLVPGKEKGQGIVVCPHGAHGITAAPSGYFVAPCGRAGIMMLKPGSDAKDLVGGLRPDIQGMYVYRVLALKGRNGQDLLVSACRQGGIGITECAWGQETYNMRFATFPNLDVVDVCAVSGEPDAPAVAAVGREGTLLLVRDAWNDKNPKIMKFNAVQGTVYRLLGAQGHLFVLTSQGLYGLMNLGQRLVQGMPSGEFTTLIHVLPMEAVDANIVDDRWLLVILPDEIRRFDVNLISESTPESLRNGEIRQVTTQTLTPPVWQVHRMQQKSKQVVGTAWPQHR